MAGGIDREADGASRNITVRATSSDGSFTDQVFTIAINDVDEFDVGAVTDSDATANAVDENSANGTLVNITAAANDADITNNTITYSLQDDDGGRFAIGVNTGIVTVAGAIDRESDGASRNITVRATSSDGSFTDQVFTININDLDEFDVGAVSDSDVGANTVAENAVAGTAVGMTTVAADVDATNNTISYSLDDDAGGRFTVNSVTGVVTVNAALDYESFTSHSVTIRATSSDGSSATQSFMIDVTDVSESGVTAISDTDAAADFVLENSAGGTAVGVTAFADDLDGSDTVSYSLDDNAGGRFAVDANTGLVTVAGAIDRETAGSYDITVRATSTDTSTTTRTVTITIGDVDEFDVGAVSDGAATANAVNENAIVGTSVGVTAAASDADATNNTITYDLQDDDGGRFAIDANTGIVTVAGAIDREADGASRNVTVRATSSDGSFTDQVFTIAINDVDEFDVGAVTDSDVAINVVDENSLAGTVVGVTALASDADATDSITYSLVDDDGGRFGIDINTGVVTVAGGIDRESDGSSRNITVRATSSDGSFTDQAFAISINDVDESDVGAVTDSDATPNSVAESAMVGTTVGVTAAASDADATNNVISYSLDDDAGGRFAIHSATGVVTVNAALDYETSTSHGVIVRATSSDGSFSTQSFIIDVIDQNDSAPAIANNNLVLAEGQTVTLTSGNLNSVDPDSTPFDLTYTVSNVTGGRFALAANAGVAISSFTQQQVNIGQVIFAHDGGELAPTYRATVSDGVQQDGPQLANVTFTNTNDAPQAGGLSFESTTSSLTGTVLPAATDVDGDPLTVLLFATPAHGTVSLAADGTFVYTATASFSGVDSFSYQAFDGQSLSNVAVVSITVVLNASPPPPPLGDNDATPDTSPTNSASDSPVVQESGDIGVLGPDAAPRAMTRTPEVTGTADEPVELPLAVDVEIEDGSDELFLDSVRAEAESLALRNRIMASDANDTDSPAAREGRSGSVNGLSEDAGITSLGQSARLWRDLDQFQQSLDSDLQLNAVTIGSVGTLVSGFTVGYVLWVLRSGLLLSSLLASLPAWTMFDPMLIMPVGSTQDDGQEESLEQIVESQTTLAASRQRQQSETEPSL